MSFFGPVSAFQENVSNCLAPVAAGALVGVGSVNSMEVGPKANFACAHLRDHRADRPVRAVVYLECSLAWSHAESEQVSAVFGGLPGLLPLFLHCLADNRFGRGCKCLERWRLRWWLGCRPRVRVVAGCFLGRSVRGFVPRHADVCGDPTKLHLPSEVAKFVECSDRLDQYVLAGRGLGVPYGLDGGLIVGEYGAPCRCVRRCVHIKHQLQGQYEPSQLCRVYSGRARCAHVFCSLCADTAELYYRCDCGSTNVAVNAATVGVHADDFRIHGVVFFDGLLGRFADVNRR